VTVSSTHQRLLSQTSWPPLFVTQLITLIVLDHVVQLVVSKAEERKMMDQTEFETVSTKFWTLLRGNAHSDDKCITKE